MEEDIAFNHYLKGALESGKVLIFKAQGRTSVYWKWWVPLAAAASLTMVVALYEWFKPGATIRDGGKQDMVSAIIELLSTTDEVEVVQTDGAAPTDLLLAWQDAPCCEVLSLAE